MTDKAPTTDAPLTSSAAAAPDPAAPEVDLTGMTLGDFRIRRKLGRGGMGQVYLAEQISLKRAVALKTLRSDLAANRLSLERFDAEAKAVAKATHANIVQIYVIEKALVQNETVHYLALEYVDGRNLRELLEKKGTPDLPAGLAIMQQVAAALQRASELGIIHRDIKPENILISRQGEVKVADFGLSRCFDDPAQAHNLTQTGVSMGTPLYMAPEQVELRPVDPRTDIYSLGVTCYHMWAGQPPFRGASPFEIAAQHVQKEAEPLQNVRPDLPPELCVLIHRMMAKKPEDRPQTSREIVREVARLRDALAGSSSGNLAALGAPDLLEPPAPTPAASPAATRPGWAKHYLLPGLAVLLAFAAGLGGMYAYRAYSKTPSPKVDEPLAPATYEPAEDKEPDLIRLKEKHWPPKKPGDMRFALDLGVFYLKNGRLDKAETLFQQMSGEKESGQAGKIGIAMVLALRGEAAQSNSKFSEIKNKDKSQGDMANYWNYPPWRQMMATALYHNKSNLPGAITEQQIDRWLRPAGPLGKTVLPKD